METTCEEFLQVTDHNRVSASSEINIQPVLRWPTQNIIEAKRFYDESCGFTHTIRHRTNFLIPVVNSLFIKEILDKNQVIRNEQIHIKIDSRTSTNLDIELKKYNRLLAIFGELVVNKGDKLYKTVLRDLKNRGIIANSHLKDKQSKVTTKMSTPPWKDPVSGKEYSLRLPYKSIITLIIIGYVMVEYHDYPIIEADSSLSTFQIHNERNIDGTKNNALPAWFIYADYDAFCRLMLIKSLAKVKSAHNMAEYLPKMALNLKKSLIVISPYKITLESSEFIKVFNKGSKEWTIEVNVKNKGNAKSTKKKNNDITITSMEISSIDEDIDKHSINKTDVYERVRQDQLVALGFSKEEVELIRYHLRMGKFKIIRYEDWINANVEELLVDARSEETFLHLTVADILHTAEVSTSQLSRFRVCLDLK